MERSTTERQAGTDAHGTTAGVSVLVTTSDPGPALRDLVASIDAQTLPTTEFELVVVDASTDGSTDRLQHLAGRRPNVTVLTADPATSEADRLALGLDRAVREHVLVVGQRQRPAPRALEVLIGTARRTEADLVLGRVVSSARSGCAALPDDADRLEVAGLDPAGCVALVRRGLLAKRTDAGAALLDLPALIGQADVVSVVGRYACAHEGGSPIASGEGVVLDVPTYRWSRGMLQVTVRARIPEAGSAAPRAWLVLTHDLAEVALPATIEPAGLGGTGFAVSATVDPRTAAGGQPLDDGRWGALLRLAWPGHEATVPLAAGSTSSAVVAGSPYVVSAAELMQLDAGATRTSAVGRVTSSRASIAETVHGTVITLDHPELHVHGDAIVDARLLLDRFELPARLICTDGRARLEAYVSSLAGTSAISVLVGTGRPVPTGLRLQVDGLGTMALETVPHGPPTAPARSAAGAAPLLQRLRRRAPGALEPVVHRLARVRVLRQAYRRMISR